MMGTKVSSVATLMSKIYRNMSRQENYSGLCT